MEFITGVFVGLTALVWWEILGIVVLGFWLFAGAAFDRRENNSVPLWIAAAIVMIVAAFSTGSFSGFWATVTGMSFWKSVGLYLLIGLAYSWAIEFTFAVRRASKKYAEEWKYFVSLRKDELSTDSIDNFCMERRNRNLMVHLERNGLTVEPKLNKPVLVDNITVWTLLWPAYLVSLILGDLIFNIVESLVDLMSNLGSRFVKFMFRDTFKI